MPDARSQPFHRPVVAAIGLAVVLLTGPQLVAADAHSVTVPETLAARPLSVECVAAPRTSSGFNVLVACGPKESPDHWELYTYAGGGDLSVYLPGCEPAEIRSGVNVCDGKPHHLAATIAADEVRMWVDGREVSRVGIRPRMPAAAGTPGERTLWLGGYAGQIGCDGSLDLVRISHGLRDFTAASAADTPAVEADTLALWRPAEATRGGSVPDAGPLRLVASRGAVPAAARVDDHFGVASVGFAWQESDSRDDRWQATDVGPFLSLSLDLPSGPAAKALAVKLGGESTACFDTILGSYRTVWTGGFLRFDPGRFGLIGRPVIDGSVAWDAGDQPLWPGRDVRFRAILLHGPRTLTETLVGDRVVLETATAGAGPCVVRSLEIQPGRDPLRLVLVRDGEAAARREGTTAILERPGRRTAVGVLAASLPGCDVEPLDGRIELVLPAADEPLRVDVAVLGGAGEVSAAAATIARPGPLAALAVGGAARWGEPLETRGRIGRGPGSFVLDSVPLPVDNPWRALLFIGDHDFFPDGRLAACTVHGDVWVVDGLDESLERVLWKRFATGLFQPLGLKVIDGHVHVLGRDRITRLVDVDGDGEADRYESFSDANPTSLGGHDYAAGLETDSEGNLYFVQCATGGMGGLYRVSPDGNRQELVADGFRNPNGLGVGPGDVVTVAPQEGTWTPASCICEVRPGGFYGFGGPRPGPRRPRGYDPPLCWIPRLVDNSSGSQTWLTTDRYGPLADMPVSLSFGRCRILLVLREEFSAADGGTTVQGGTIDLGLTGDSGLMRGCIGPHDGLLWVTGTKGWVSSGVEDGCLQRLRPTGEPIRLPLAVETHANGLLVRFSTPLDPDTAGDPGAWDVSAWDYRYSAAYGSADYSPSAPQREGHDPLPVRSATLLEEHHAVFLELGRVPEAMQLAIRGNVRAADGTLLDQTIHWTVNGVRTTRIEPRPAAATPAAGIDPATEGRLVPGLVTTFTSPTDDDTRTSRLVALAVPAGKPATPWLAPGPFTATFRGFIRAAISSDVRFGLRGTGRVRLRLGDTDVLSAEGDLAAAAAVVVRLRRGPTPVVIEYESPSQGDAACELLWSAGGPGLTPVPSQALAHDPSSADDLHRGRLLRTGREAFADHHCATCHAAGDLHPALVRDAPRLGGVGARITTAWLAAWLADPRSLAPRSTMPHLLAGQPDTAAADIAACLTMADTPAAIAATPHPAAVDRGLVLWERLGCIGCHTLAATPDATDDRRSLALAAAKYTAAGLVEFLASPLAHRPATTMPDFGLAPQDAEALAAFLTARGQPLPATAAGTGDAARGRGLVAALGCGRCHAGIDAFASTAAAAPPLEAIPATSLDSGCLAGEPAAADRAPRWSLTADVREALAVFLGDGPRSRMALRQDAAADRAAHTVATLRCGVCHARDGRPAELPERLVEDGELGLPIERLPDLTWAGEKLRGEWTTALLAGRIGERSRPWLATRMPAWPGHAAALAEGLAAEHGLMLADADASGPEITAAESLGGRLVQRDGGLDCRQCHGVGPLTTRQDNDAQGISFRHVRGRLRRGWYDRWMLDPLAIDPATKMPRFTTDGTHTAVSSILAGDARSQFAAIWSWLGTVAADVTLPTAVAAVGDDEDVATRARRLFHRDNLVAWCIVPFDARRRTPEERAEMLERLGFRHFAYDWRDEHVPEFNREFDALARHGVALDAFWSPAGHADALLETFRGRGLQPAFWVMIAAPDDLDQAAKVRHAADSIRPLCEAAAKAGCSVALYNHGGWGGEPENQIAVIETLGLDNVGIVYNQHHGHDHLPRFKELLPRMLPHLLCLNLNGMTAGGDRIGKKILPLGQGDLDVDLLRTIVESGYDGPIGILGHTADDAEQRLLDNLDGLDWIVGELTGRPIPKPVPRTK